MRRIIFRAPNWLGDSVLVTPTLRALKQVYPRAHLTVLAVPGVGELLRHHPGIDEILTYDQAGEHRGLQGLLKLAGYLHRKRYTHGYIMPNSFHSAFLFWLAKIPHRIGYPTCGRRLLLSDPREAPPGILDQHQVFYYLGILRPEERAEADPQPGIVVREEEREWAAERLAREGVRVDGGPVAVIPGATYGTAKRWPVARYVEVGKRIVRLGHPVVLFGNHAESQLCREAKEAIGAGAYDFGGRTTVRQLMALLSECVLAVCNDSGPMHIASTIGLRVVVPIGPTDPVTTRPWGDGHVLIRRPTACAPCLERDCPLGHHACMERIGVDDVWAGVRQALRP